MNVVGFGFFLLYLCIVPNFPPSLHDLEYSLIWCKMDLCALCIHSPGTESCLCFTMKVLAKPTSRSVSLQGKRLTVQPSFTLTQLEQKP